MRWQYAFFVITSGLVSAPLAQADETLVPLVINGDWSAFEHRDSMLSPPDVCLAGNMESKVLFRSDANGTELRVVNDSWSLPPHVGGSIQLSVGNYKHDFLLTGNTDNMVISDVSDQEILPMFSAMDVSGSMVVTVGKYQKTVSLNGSTKVTNAFRTCAGIKGAPTTAGSNPFQ